MQTLVVSSDGTQTFAEMAPAAEVPIPMPAINPPSGLNFITREEHEAALGEQRWREVQMKQNPALFLAREKLERARRVTEHYGEICADLSKRFMEAKALAQRNSMFYTEELRPQGLGGPTPVPGRNNRANALEAELREAREELACAVEEEQTAEAVVTAELAKVQL
jgi:hypothetical protein